MLIENFIAWFLRRTSGRYFSFGDDGRIEAPQPPAEAVQLYVHIPFCTRLCPYCSFHRVAFEEDLTRRYFKALRRELELYHEKGFKFSGVYMGGGTPTILLDELSETIELINRLFAPDEISVETNPDRLEKSVLEKLAALGVKRISVGIQTFDDELLKVIGRYDKYGSGAELKERLKAAKGYVQTLNADMIYNFPLQSREMLDADLDILDEIGPDQITFYPLMISDATRKKMEKIMGRHSFAKEKKFYGIISERLKDSYKPGSAWCFSRKGTAMIDEYIVTNNEYVGVGSGAFGLVGDAIYANTFSIEEYIAVLERDELPLKSKKDFTSREILRYTFLMDLFGLKMDRQHFRKRFGRDIWAKLTMEALFFAMIGGIKVGPEYVTLTEKGQYYWVIMMREFFTGVDNFRDLSREVVGINPVLD